MKLIIPIIFFFLLTILFACKKEKEIVPSIIGRWQSVYRKGFYKNLISTDLSSNSKNYFYEFKENGQFSEYILEKNFGRDTLMKVNSFPYRLSKDSLVFSKPVDIVRTNKYDFFYNYKIIGDTLILVENLQLSIKNGENEFAAKFWPDILPAETIKRFGRKYEDYYLELKYVKIK